MKVLYHPTLFTSTSASNAGVHRGGKIRMGRLMLPVFFIVHNVDMKVP
jgi:hypothetical protein